MSMSTNLSLMLQIYVLGRPDDGYGQGLMIPQTCDISA